MFDSDIIDSIGRIIIILIFIIFSIKFIGNIIEIIERNKQDKIHVIELQIENKHQDTLLQEIALELAK